jgi:hypothetical protein
MADGFDKVTEVFQSALASLAMGEELPQGNCVTDVATRILYKILDEYMAGATQLSAEVDGLVISLFNSQDDVVKAMGVGERQVMWSVLNMLRKQKESRLAKSAEANP